MKKVMAVVMKTVKREKMVLSMAMKKKKKMVLEQKMQLELSIPSEKERKSSRTLVTVVSFSYIYLAKLDSGAECPGMLKLLKCFMQKISIWSRHEINRTEDDMLMEQFHVCWYVTGCEQNLNRKQNIWYIKKLSSPGFIN